MTTATAAHRATASNRTPSRGDTLTGTGTLIRFILRRDRVRLPIWIAALLLATVSTAASFPDLYPTVEDRQARAELLDSPAAIAMSGPGFGLDDYTFGPMLAHEMLGFLGIFVALMSVLLVVRHTRTEEETGRAELVRAAVVGRHAHTTAAVTVAAAANVLLGALFTITLPSLGIEGIGWTGSFFFGAAMTGVGLAFTGIAALTVQISENSRAASGMAAAVIGVAFVLRAVGDIGNGALSWLSPIGWAQQTRAYVDGRWLPLALLVATAAITLAVAVVLSTRRDVGAGLRHSRPGPANASASLGTPLGLAFRLQRAMFIAWCIGMFLFGATFGSILPDVEEFVSDNSTMQNFVAEQQSGTMMESFLVMIISMLAIVSTIYGVIAVQKLRGEETAGRAEPVLATAISRTHWAGSHLVIALAGGAAVLLSAGIGMVVSAAATTGEADIVGDVVAAVAVNVPALWISTGLAIALFGFAPRALGLAWAVLVYALIVVMLGELLQFPGWMDNLSPFGHVPGIPAEELTITPMVVLSAITAALVLTGIAAFRRRDLTTN